MALSVTGLIGLLTPYQQDHGDVGVAKSPDVEAIRDVNFMMPYGALNPAADLQGNRPESSFDPNDDYWGLPRSTGYEEVATYCSGCHSLEIVMQQQQSEKGWRELLVWMTEKQGMAVLEAEVETTIVDYLAREF